MAGANQEALSIYGISVYSGATEIEFDPVKDAANRAKHGLPSAAGAAPFEDGNHLIIPSLRPVDGEPRFKIVGMVEGRLRTAVFVWRGEAVRFVSVRPSNKGEARAYHSD